MEQFLGYFFLIHERRELLTSLLLALAVELRLLIEILLQRGQNLIDRLINLLLIQKLVMENSSSLNRAQYCDTHSFHQ